jgi:toxin ParE1/3/4
MASFDLAPEAEADLDDIFNYTARLWGADQGYKYLMQLNECAEKIGVGNSSHKDFSHIRPGLRSFSCQQHYIYFARMEDMSVRIVAVLHEKMDLMARIAGRIELLKGQSRDL